MMINTVTQTRPVHKNSEADIAALFDQSAAGFIRHPDAFPLNIRRRWREPVLSLAEEMDDESELGLCFFSEKHLDPGTRLELSIPLRGEEQKFAGEVVLVRALRHGYEIGLWLRSHTDACRARIVEQICYIECYLKDKQKNTINPINHEQGTREWISRFAAHFPA